MGDLFPIQTSLFVVLGNQLFPYRELRQVGAAGGRFYLGEDVGLCTYVRHHKQKIVLFLAAMRAYRDELRRQGCDVHYDTLGEPGDTYEDRLGRHVRDGAYTHLVTWEIEDKFFERRISAFAQAKGLKHVVLNSPMFVTPRETFAAYLEEAKGRPHMAHFYQRQRRRLGVLMDEAGQPIGGRWSYDEENRKKIPKTEPIPKWAGAKPSEHVGDLLPMVNERFADHPGALSVSGWWLPTTRAQALAWWRGFLKQRFAKFGPYEDALSTRGPVLWHSAMTPVLNLGLVTPQELVDSAIEYAEDSPVPLNSLEGFIRQVIGWREFIRGIYQQFSEQQETTNFFGASRRLTRHWYDGDTGVLPLDDVIRKAQRYGWAHHIERLMVVGNLMLTCEVAPSEAYRWFMEMFVDSSDWVMGPNVYGMGIFSDGGVFATKPYLAGSNYILKMSDYARPKPAGEGLFGADATWTDVMDGLYWRFIERHLDYFKGNARLAQVTGTLSRMKPERKRRIFDSAERFVDRVTC